MTTTAKSTVVAVLQSGEQTDVCLRQACVFAGYSWEQGGDAIDALIDAGTIVSTVIEQNFGGLAPSRYLAALRLA